MALYSSHLQKLNPLVCILVQYNPVDRCCIFVLVEWQRFAVHLHLHVLWGLRSIYKPASDEFCLTFASTVLPAALQTLSRDCCNHASPALYLPVGF